MQSIDRESLILENQKLVYKIANKHRWAIDKNIEYDDLVQTGFIGLIKAVDRNDASKGFKFSTYAYRLIEGEITNFLRDKRRTVRLPCKLENLITKITSRKISHLEPQEIADQLDCEVHLAEQAKRIIERGDSTTLNTIVIDSDSATPFIDIISSECDYSNMFVKDFMNILNDKEKTIVKGRMLGMLEREIGNVLGISQKMVNYTKKQIAVKLKNYMEVV